MDTLFIMATLILGFIFIALILSDIKIELKYNNTLSKERNELLTNED